MDTAILDEAYDRFSSTGPEWGEDQLTNHGPMAAEVLVRRGHAADVPRWVDSYVKRLDELPAATSRITADNWREAMGDGRIGDWTAYFSEQVREQPWRQVLVTWWPRLLPGIVAGATHGVIRTGHAVRTLLAGDKNPAAAAEMARGLAFWAARARAVPQADEAAAAPAGRLDAAAALESVPRVPDQSGPVADRFGQLPRLSGWTGSLAALRGAADPDDARGLLADLVDAATARYLTSGHASPILLVHTATAPNAVLHTLPALPHETWAPSLSAVWAASAAITATYAPAQPAPREALPDGPDGPDAVAGILDRAAAHGDEHVIKFTDTAAEVYERTRNAGALAAAVRITQLISPSS
jgi:Questin oxidase-like